MRVFRSFALVAAVASSGLLTASANAQSSRVITRAQLPTAFRAQLERGEIARVSRGNIDSVEAEAPQVTLRAGELLAVRTGAKATPATRPSSDTLPHSDTLPATDSVYRLPFRYLGLDREGSAPAVYIPFYWGVEKLRYNPGTDVFEGTFQIGLQDSARPGDIREITAPVRLKVLGDADSTRPDSVVMRRTNAQDETIRVYADGSADSVRVQIVPAFDRRGVDLWLQVRQTLMFENPPRSIQGLGVETATLTVNTRGNSRDTAVVTITPSKGSLDTRSVRVADAGAVVKLRSAGLGDATVRATANGWSTAQITVAYRFPYEFLGAALAGGVLGGLVAYMYAKRRTAALLRQYLLKGVLAGLLTCVVYFGLGITLVQFEVKIEFFSELAVFALSALAAAFGIPLLAPGTKQGARA